jgi:hypothetical protein
VVERGDRLLSPILDHRLGAWRAARSGEARNEGVSEVSARSEKEGESHVSSGQILLLFLPKVLGRRRVGLCPSGAQPPKCTFRQDRKGRGQRRFPVLERANWIG